MKSRWLADPDLIVGRLSIGAGVAIRGLPHDVSVDATIIRRPPRGDDTDGARDELAAADAALRLADDLDLLPDSVGSIDEAPHVLERLADTELPDDIGLDRA